jgi:hypothetical protein
VRERKNEPQPLFSSTYFFDPLGQARDGRALEQSQPPELLRRDISDYLVAPVDHAMLVETILADLRGYLGHLGIDEAAG